MKKYLLKRLLRLIPVFLGVTILAFLLTGLSSVDAVDLKESSSGGVMSLSLIHISEPTRRS